MSFDPKDWLEKDWQNNWEPKIKAEQEKFKQLTDDGFIALHNSIWKIVLAGQVDSDSYILFVAAEREAKRRARSACWFWKRWRRPGECQKWLDHLDEIEKKALEWGRARFLA